MPPPLSAITSIPYPGIRATQFSYSREVVAELESALSAERLGTYVSAVRGQDKEQALRLYAWNVALGSAFYGMLQGLEVTLRNAMHGRLAAVYGPEWYDNPRVGLDDGGTRRIDNVKIRLGHTGRGRVSRGQVVAGLSFGFWVPLLGPGGRSVWASR